MNLLPFGAGALLAEVESLDEVLRLHRALAASVPEGVTDLVPAARTVLIVFESAVLSAAAARTWVQQAKEADGTPDAATEIVELDVVYDGEDLAETAVLLGVSPEALAAAHQSIEWTVAFTGFAPGFGYLVSDDWPFDVPRLASPRTRVPVGAVGLAGAFTGAYPRETPGGWRLIGTTRARLFDVDATPPALLTPGASVRFTPSSSLSAREQAVRRGAATRDEEAGRRGVCSEPPLHDRASLGHATPRLRAHTSEPGEGRSRDTPERGDPSSRSGFAGARSGTERPSIRIVEPGLLATIQDLGRPGHASLGVAPSGALDRGALRTANRLLGNPEGAAAIEVTMGGFRAVAERDCWFAVAGAWGGIRLDGKPLDPYQAHPWRAGAELHLDWFERGARAYLALRGGISAKTVLGSASTDLLSGLGPVRLTAGGIVALGPETADDIPFVDASTWGAPAGGILDIALGPGPRANWFTAEANRTLFEAEWTVSNQADRVGIRLDGPELPRARTEELPSEAMVPGALQVPPSGRPVVLGADGPVTGGYPVVAVATSLDALAQARPGTRIRFRHARP